MDGACLLLACAVKDLSNAGKGAKASTMSVLCAAYLLALMHSAVNLEVLQLA